MGNLAINSRAKLKDSEVKAIFRNGKIVFDANVLLNLYRVKVDTRVEVLSLMRRHASQLWLPYQVCWEYHNNREKIIDDITNAYFEKLTEKLSGAEKTFKTQTEMFPYHPSVDVSELRELLKSVLAPVYERISELRRTDIGFSQDNDSIYAELQKLFVGKVGEDYTHSQLLEVFSLARQRFEYKIAPGFGDLEKKKDAEARRLYGDVILWLQTISMAKEEQTDIVFVTGDSGKNDWFKKKENGKLREPINCLLDEFYGETDGRRILILTEEDFLYLIRKFDKDAISESSIQNIKEISALTTMDRIIAQQKEYNEKIETARTALANLQFPSPDLSKWSALRESIESLKQAGYTTIPAWQSAIDAMKEVGQLTQPSSIELIASHLKNMD